MCKRLQRMLQPFCLTAQRYPDDISSGELLSKPDEEPFRSSYVAEAIYVFVSDHLAYQLRSTLDEPFERLIDVVDSKHDAEIAQGIYGGGAVILDNRRC